MKPKTIVSVLDSSSVGKDIPLMTALSLAQWYDADLHVVRVGGSRRSKERGEDGRGAEVAERISRAAHAWGFSGVRTIPAVLRGAPVPAIARYARAIAADLLVVAKHAAPTKGFWAPGAFATTVGKAVKSPTMVIPGDAAQPSASGAPFRHILSAIDFSDASRRALSKALVLAQQSGGHLRVLHVLDGFPYETVYSGSRAFRMIDDFEAHVARVNRELQSLIPTDASNWSEIDVAAVSGRPHEVILAAASESPTDLIVLGVSRRPRLEDFIAGSTARRVLRRATTPVLLVPGPSTAVRLDPAVEFLDRFARDPSVIPMHAAETGLQEAASWR